VDNPDSAVLFGIGGGIVSTPPYISDNIFGKYYKMYKLKCGTLPEEDIPQTGSISF